MEYGSCDDSTHSDDSNVPCNAPPSPVVQHQSPTVIVASAAPTFITVFSGIPNVSKAKEVTLQRGQDGLLGFTFEKSPERPKDPWIVTQITPGGPLAQSGLVRIYDELVAVDGVEVIDKWSPEISQLVRGAPNSEVRLLVRSPSNHSLG
mmetsp:Transcript_77788/g.209640  ORF Transcript_77788/g.209640 Transcript_77788/m.209640 type:complete len:149 (+) Transcript_77788:84-530(+)